MLSKIILEEFVHKVKNEIEDAEQIVIVTHTGPDGDALGSALGLWHYLMTIQKETTVIVPPTTNPNVSKNFFVSCFPPIFLIVTGSP